MHLVLLSQCYHGWESAVDSSSMEVCYSSQMYSGTKLETTDVQLVMNVGLNQALQELMLRVSVFSNTELRLYMAAWWILKVSVKENEVPTEKILVARVFSLQRQVIYQIRAKRLNYLTKDFISSNFKRRLSFLLSNSGIFRFPFVTHFMTVSLRKSPSRFDFLVWNAIIPLIRDICNFPHTLF